ncbi:MAG: protein kinase, partial [bacterium]
MKEILCLKMQIDNSLKDMLKLDKIADYIESQYNQIFHSDIFLRCYFHLTRGEKINLMQSILAALVDMGINQEIFFQNDFKSFHQVQRENELIKKVVEDIDLISLYPHVFLQAKQPDKPWVFRSNCFHKIFPEPFTNRYLDMLKMEVQGRVLLELTHRCFECMGARTISDIGFISLPGRVIKQTYRPDSNIYASPVLFNKDFDKNEYFAIGYIRLNAIGKGGTGSSYRGNIVVLKKISSQGHYSLVTSNWGDILIGNEVIIKQLLSYDHYNNTILAGNASANHRITVNPGDGTNHIINRLKDNEKIYYEKYSKEKYEAFLKRLSSEIKVIYTLTKPKSSSAFSESGKLKPTDFSELENEIKLDDKFESRIRDFLMHIDKFGRNYGIRYIVELLDDHLGAKIFIMKAVKNAQDLYQIYQRFCRHINMNLSLVMAFEIGMGLEYIHRHNIIHRDLKDKNIIISDSGQMVIIDYGEAINNALNSPKLGGAFGTPVYMSPEQVMGQVSCKSDIYSLGI